MRRQFVSGFPRALLSLSQEKSSGVEIDVRLKRRKLAKAHLCTRYPRLEIALFDLLMSNANMYMVMDKYQG